jgi:hypothetical protein
MFTKPRHRLVALSPLFVAAALVTRTAAAEGGVCDVHGSPVGIVVRVERAPVREVVTRLAEATGLTVEWMDDTGEEQLTLVSPPLPLATAVDRVLGHRNYFLSMGRRRLVVGSLIRGRSPAASVADVDAMRPSSAPAPVTSWLETADVQHLLHVARHSDDPERRGDALRQIARGPAGFEARTTLAHALAFDSSAKVRAAAVGAFADLETPPIDALLAAARNDPSSGVRRRARALLQRVDPEIVRLTLGDHAR